MDPFLIGVCVVVALAALGACAAAWSSRGIPLGGFGHRDEPTRSRVDAALEQQDLEQMLAATNRRREARGLPQRSLADAVREFESD